jgi:cytidine deaminase
MIKTTHFDYQEYLSAEELSAMDQKLLQSAKEAASKAYAPYSAFRVGAALLLENGEIILGNNQENAAYPSGLCAERVAMFYASAKYPEVAFKVLAITADSDKLEINHPISPCGSCRQVMVEYETISKGDIKVILAGKTGKVIVVNRVKDLLPFSFGPNELK